ncbi:MAG: ACT domain-containing protein [Bryobacteraceae bacterium]
MSPFAHPRLGEYKPIPVTSQKVAYYLRFCVRDRPGIIAALASILAEMHISLDAVLQLPSEAKDGLPFVITVEPTTEKALRSAIAQMNELDFMAQPVLSLPMEPSI